jgi:hypothetical protein
LKFTRRFVTGNYNVLSSAGFKNGTAELYKDVFGFRKVVLVASASGKVYALDSISGDVIWSRVLSLGGSPGATFRIVRLFTIRSVSDWMVHPPEAALIVTRISRVSMYLLMSQNPIISLIDGHDDSTLYF